MYRMRFQREDAPSLFTEVRPLLEKHWAEIAHYQDIPLDPDYDAYEKMNSVGFVRCFTARDDDGMLVGYGVYFVRPALHYKGSIQAYQDILFMHPDFRGKGGLFIKWCDDQLAAEGVQAVYHHVKAAHNFGKLLERLGYQLVDLIYARRLD